MKLKRAATTLFLLALIGLGFVWVAASVVARPINRPVSQPAPPGRVVHMQAADGVPIEGSYWPGRTADAPAILLLHGVNNNRNIFRRQIDWLSGLGYAVLAIDFRGHGGSGAVQRSFGWREAMDARAAYDFLRREAPRRRVGVIGVSLGGAAALLGENGPLPADAMVLHAVYPDLRTAIANRLARSGSTTLAAWSEPLLSYQAYPRYRVAPERIAPREGIRNFEGAVLVIGGTADLDTTVADTRSLYAAAPSPKSLWLVDGANHVETSKLWTDEYRTRVRCFFHRTLGEPGGIDPLRQPLGAPCATSPSS